MQFAISNEHKGGAVECGTGSPIFPFVEHGVIAGHAARVENEDETKVRCGLDITGCMAEQIQLGDRSPLVVLDTVPV